MIKTVSIGSNHIIVVPRSIHSVKMAILNCSEGLSDKDKDKDKDKSTQISDLLSVQPNIITLINGGYCYYNNMDRYPCKKLSDRNRKPLGTASKPPKGIA